MPHPHYTAERASQAGIIPVKPSRIIELSSLSGRTPTTGAAYFPAATSPAEATAAARYVFGTDHVDFAGMVLGTMPAYLPTPGATEESD